MKYLLLIPVALAGFFLPLWSFLILVMVYSLFFPSGILLVVAVCIDAFFGNPDIGFSYIYTVGTSGILVCISLVKPHLALYA
jgi:hypothetical protein